MVTTYYFDESGNTGDLAMAAPDFSFGGQPVFVLACVGTSEPDDVAREIDRLRRQHKIQSPELKFVSIRRKPQFALDLVEYIAGRDLPIFVEVTDKRYAICIQIVESLIVPPVGPNDYSGGAAFVKNVFADRLYHSAPNQVLSAFSIACREGTRERVNEVFEALLAWLNSLEADEVVDGLRLFARDTYKDFAKEGGAAAELLRIYRPAPDRMRSGKLVWMLPHVPSLLHIYGRINRSLNRNLGGARFIHDEQMQFDVALKEGMELAEGPVGKTLRNQPLADFDIQSPVLLEFVVSDDYIGVQLADLLAGIVSYCIKPFATDGEQNSEHWLSVLRALLCLTDRSRSSGINFVVPAAMNDRIMRRVAMAPKV